MLSDLMNQILIVKLVILQGFGCSKLSAIVPVKPIMETSNLKTTAYCVTSVSNFSIFFTFILFSALNAVRHSQVGFRNPFDLTSKHQKSEHKSQERI